MNVRLKDELIQRGYLYKEMRLDQKYRQFFNSDGKLVMTIENYYEYPFVSPTAKRISKNKALSYAFAAAHDVITPATVQSADRSVLNNFLKKYGRVVVKPVGLGGGKGLSVNVTTQEELLRAVDIAIRPDAEPLIQEQFEGDEIRLTVINGTVLSVIHRCSPVLTGDGLSTISQLLKNENEDRLKLAFPLLQYPQLTSDLINTDDIDYGTIPAQGEIIRLATTSMISGGASFYGITSRVHESYIKIAERLACRLNPPFLVVDFMVKDYTARAESGNYIFLEFNTAPSLRVYSSLRGGDDQRHIVSDIADLIDIYARGLAPGKGVV